MAKNDKNSGAKHEETTAAAAPSTAPKGFDVSRFQGEEYVKQVTGFTPYWAPSEEAHMAGHTQGFHGLVVGYEPATDGKAGWERFLVRASEPVECRTGKAADDQRIIVAAGEIFNLSRYEAMHLDKFLGCTVAVWATKKESISGGKTLWTWEVRATKADDAKLLAKRQELYDQRFNGKAATPELVGKDAGNHAARA